MPVTDNSKNFCFDSNPDIAGRGLLSATYTQVVLSIFITLWASLDQVFEKVEIKTMNILRRGSLLLSSAIAVTAIVQLSKNELNAYHASIVLLLGFLLDGPLLGTFITMSLHEIWERWFGDNPTNRRLSIASLALALRTANVKAYDPAVQKSSVAALMLLARTLHAILSLGIISSISPPSCGTSLSGLFRIPVLSTGSKVCWGFVVAIRFIDVGASLVKFLERATSRITVTSLPDDIPLHWMVYIKLFIALGVAVTIIVEIEMLKHHAVVSQLVSGEEAEWGFGQILSLCVLANQLFEIAGMVIAKCPKFRRKQAKPRTTWPPTSETPNQESSEASRTFDLKTEPGSTADHLAQGTSFTKSPEIESGRRQTARVKKEVKFAEKRSKSAAKRKDLPPPPPPSHQPNREASWASRQSDRTLHDKVAN